MPKELKPILSQLNRPKLHRYKHIPYYTAKLNNQKIILARTGIGEVNAEIIISLLASHFQPKVIFFSGIAGGLQTNLPVGSIIIVTRTIKAQHNTFDAKSSQTKQYTSPTISQKIPNTFKMSSALINQAKKNKTLPNMDINFGPSATDVKFNPDDNNDTLLEKNRISAVDMEDYGIAQGCQQQHTPLIIISAISDNIVNQISYTQKNAKLAAGNAAKVTIAIIKTLL